MPLPTTLRARGASLRRLLNSLINLLLLEEVVTDLPALSWRRHEQGMHLTLKLTKAGYAAVAVLDTNGSIDSIPSEITKPSVAEAADLSSHANCDQPASLTGAATPSGKLGEVLMAVGAAHGATLDELVALTGWLPHTTRAALTRLRQRGYHLELIKRPDRKAYCLSQSGKG